MTKSIRLFFIFCCAAVNIPAAQAESTFINLRHTYKEKFFNQNFENIFYQQIKNNQKTLHFNQKLDTLILSEKEIKAIKEKESVSFEKAKNSFDYLLYLFDKKTSTEPGHFHLSQETWKDLSIFTGPEQKIWHSLSYRLSRALTKSGSVWFDHLLANPSDDISLLKEKTDFLSFLQNNPDVHTELTRELKKLEPLESKILEFFSSGAKERRIPAPLTAAGDLFWHEASPSCYATELCPEPDKKKSTKQKAFETVFQFPLKFNQYCRKKMDNSDFALGTGLALLTLNIIPKTWNLLNNGIGSWRRIFSKETMSVFDKIDPKEQIDDAMWTAVEKPFKDLTEKKIQRDWIKKNFNYFFLGQSIKLFQDTKDLIYPPPKDTENKIECDKPVKNFSFKKIWLISKKLGNCYGWIMYSIYNLTFPYHLTKKSYFSLKNRYHIYKQLISDLNDFSQFFTQCKIIVNRVKKHKLCEKFERLLPFSDDLKAFDDNKISHKLNTLIKEFQHPFLIPTRALRIYKQLYQMQEELAPIFVLIGKIDAHLAAFTLLQENCEEQNKFSIPTFCESKTPQLNFQCFWNPMLNDWKNAVANNMSLGQGETEAHLIISGPNKGGKSSSQNNLIINCILAQTIGVVPANSASFTPFSLFHSYKGVSDDISSDQSTFSAEVKRIKEILDDVEALDKDKKALVIADEIYSGTGAEDAEALGIAVCLEKIIPTKNNMWLITTHFPKIRNLENITNGLFINYHVEIENDTNGNFEKFTYKLKPGITFDTSVAAVAAEAGYDQSILDRYRSLRNG